MTERYAYDGDKIIADYNNSTGVLKRKYVYGPGIDEPICMIDVVNNQTYYYHYDGLGSVTVLSNSIGQVVERYTYDVFGKPTTRNAQGVILPTTDVNNRYMFTGREYEPETGLYYYRARYYKPDIGRFMQTDPIRYRAGLNLYTYVQNNPFNLVDPSGSVSGKAIICGAVCGGIGGGIGWGMGGGLPGAIICGGIAGGLCAAICDESPPYPPCPGYPCYGMPLPPGTPPTIPGPPKYPPPKKGPLPPGAGPPIFL